MTMYSKSLLWHIKGDIRSVVYASLERIRMGVNERNIISNEITENLTVMIHREVNEHLAMYLRTLANELEDELK